MTMLSDSFDRKLRHQKEQSQIVLSNASLFFFPFQNEKSHYSRFLFHESSSFFDSYLEQKVTLNHMLLHHV